MIMLMAFSHSCFMMFNLTYKQTPHDSLILIVQGLIIKLLLFYYYLDYAARPENLKKCMKLNWNVGIRKNLFRGGGMYT